MIHPAIPAFLFASAAPIAAAGTPAMPGPAGLGLAPVLLAQGSIHERIIIRVKRIFHGGPRPVGRAPLSRPVEWKERKGPECIMVSEIEGAFLADRGAVDLVMDDGTRLRAKLDGECRSLDYYPGFYLRPGRDGLICRDRDAIRMRSGGSCEIDDFKTLKRKR